MIRNKTLSLPLIAALAAGSTLPASAELRLGLSTSKTYRQNKNNIVFRTGSFEVMLYDGNFSYVGGCTRARYVFPGEYINVCAPGTSGYLSEGVLDPNNSQYRYYQITSLIGATAIEPGAPDFIRLIAAPSSKLPRPSGGFTDKSLSLFYNLHTTNVQEYSLTEYVNNRNYNSNQRSLFESEIVTGVYKYSFPRLGRPEVPAPITATVYPIPEGFNKKNNKKSGFRFTKLGQNKWNKNGFVELSFRRPNRLEWEGLTRSDVFSSVDKLYFSIRQLQNRNNPNSNLMSANTTIFPSFNNASEDPRILLRNPFVKGFNIPPVIEPGTRGVAQLELQRSFMTGAVTFDGSSRYFQVPVMFLDRYSEYKVDTFRPNQKSDILQDADGDGFNNLTEWALGSNASQNTSVPAQPVAVGFPREIITADGPQIYDNAEVGFNVAVRQGMVPAVNYVLQRSTDGGRTWTKFVTDTNWNVARVNINQGGMIRRQIQVRSRIRGGNAYEMAFPPGTGSHLYRVKVTLKKKK